jgi:hypothetical protein
VSDNGHNSQVANLVAVRGNRCVATILGGLERRVFDKLDREEQEYVRSLVKDQVNLFKDIAIDVVRSDSAVINEVWAQKLDEILEELRR